MCLIIISNICILVCNSLLYNKLRLNTFEAINVNKAFKHTSCVSFKSYKHYSFTGVLSGHQLIFFVLVDKQHQKKHI